MNDGIATAADYHWKTAHIRNRIKPHFLDFDHYPEPFKTYDALERISLLKGIAPAEKDLMGLFSRDDTEKPIMGLGLAALSNILFLSYGVTRAEKSRGVSFFSRTVPSAGGLYPCHIYLVVRHMEGLETGVYYCNMIQEVLELIQRGSYSYDQDKAFDISFFITGTFFNSAWKYRERAFRYLLLDSGHLIENLFLALRAQGFCPALDYDFQDDKISAFLSLDNEKEVPLACIHIRKKEQHSERGFNKDPELAGPCSKEVKKERDQVSYPFLKSIHDLGKRYVEDKGFDPETIKVLASEPEKKIGFSCSAGLKEPMDYEKAVMSRRSKRNFIPKMLEKKKAVVMMEAAASLYRDKKGPSSRAMAFLSLGVALQNTEGFDDGFYFFSEKGSSVLMMRQGQFQYSLSSVCLDQQWISGAAMIFLFMANLTGLEKAFGPRGYRLLLMESGRIAQRIYLAATGLFLGCCGVGALYDEEAQMLFNLNRDSALFYVVSLGSAKP